MPTGFISVYGYPICMPRIQNNNSLFKLYKLINKKPINEYDWDMSETEYYMF